MADGQHASADGPAAGDVQSRPLPEWSELWQIPTIAMSAVLIGLGLWFASTRAPAEDWDGVLAEIDTMIVSGDLDNALVRLKEVVEPNIGTATPHHQGRFHRAVGDYVVAVQQTRGAAVSANDEAIDEHYGSAEGLGIRLTPGRIEQWGLALLRLGDRAGARDRLMDLEALAVTGEATDDAKARRNSLLRALVEDSLARPDLVADDMLALLAEYRDDPFLTPADEAWANARAAEIRLADGRFAEAIDHLLPAMRRLESRDPVIDGRRWGELYTLLARAYEQQGQFDHARFYLEQAFGRFEGAESERSEALLVKARINAGEDDLESAFNAFDEIVREFPGTSAWAPALLGRAEVSGVLGDHDSAVEDYGRLRNFIRDRGPWRDATAVRVASSLIDRHDAALAMGDLDTALRYIDLAETMFTPDQVPEDVLFRIASTSRQIGDNVIAGLLAESGGRSLDMLDPALRATANESFTTAGRYFLRHARATTALPDEEQRWARSLWLAGDSLDLAGRPEEAADLFLEYIDGRSVDDPRRAQVTWRLGEARRSLRDFEGAATAYERVLDEHPRSPFGTGSIAALAQCYRELDRLPEAESRLLNVVEGRGSDGTTITPEAADYRTALVELGRLYLDTGRYREAIERLQAAVERLEEERPLLDATYRLAEAHRGYAGELRDAIETGPRLAPAERADFEKRSREHLVTAQELFGRVCDGFGGIDQRRLDRIERSLQRGAWLTRARCAFELGDYAEAIGLYERTARKYSDDYAALEALVQIVNCHDRLGNEAEAEVAHRNAMLRLEQLPETAFDDPAALMDRAVWETWLESRPLGRVAAVEDAS